MNNEQPMVWYAIRAATEAKSIDEVFINSESPEIGAVGDDFGASFYQRQDQLAADDVSSDEFNYDFMKNTEADLVVMVNPVAPLVTGKEIDQMVEFFTANELDTLIPVKEERLHAFCDNGAINFDPDGPIQSLCKATPVNFDGSGKLPMTQDNAALKICTWTVCIWRRETFMRAFEEKGAAVFSGKVGFYPQHPITSIKVSNEEDFRFAEILLRYDYMWRYPPVEYDSQKERPGYPTMWMAEIRKIEQLLLEEGKSKGHLNIVEWGSGSSTTYFANFLKQNGISHTWHAIENFYPWYHRVCEMIDEADLGDSTTVHIKSLTFEDRKQKQEESDMSEFIDFPTTLDCRFDVALVDARKRAECLEVAAKVLAPGALAILHDAERESLHWAFKHFVDGGEFVVETESPNSWGGIQKLWIGRTP